MFNNLIIVFLALLSLQAFAGNVGIGTTAPNTKLQINTSTSLDGITLLGAQTAGYTVGSLFLANVTAGSYNSITQTGDMGIIYEGTTIGTPKGFFIAPWASASTGLRLDTNGNVGIGTTTPSTPLEVIGSVRSTVTTTSDAILGLKNTNAGGRDYLVNSTGSADTTGAGNFGIYDNTAQAFRLLINSTGNVGIGTTNPGTVLEVNGEITADIGTYGNFRSVNTSASNAAFWRNDGTNFYLLLTGAGAPYGSWNTFRPFTVGMTTGAVSMSNGITVSSCSGCSVIAEMMPVEGKVEEGVTVCINSESGRIGPCRDDKSLQAIGIATLHAEQIMRMGCADSSSKENHIDFGYKAEKYWKSSKACHGWFPIALTGVHEFVKAECVRPDGSPMKYGDRLVSSAKNPGYVRPLSPAEQGGDAILGRAITICKSGEDTGIINVHIK